MRRCLGPLIGLAVFGLLVACPGCPTGGGDGFHNSNQNSNAHSNTNDNSSNGNTNANENANENANSTNANANENANENDNNSNGNDNGSGAFVDTEMANWIILDTLLNGNVTQNEATQLEANGNPAPARRMSVALDVNASAVIIHVQTDFRLPGATATQNGVALDHLDLALDQQLSYTTAFDGFIEGGFVVVQNDVSYRTTSETIVHGDWQTDARPGLTAADFADLEAQQPDFSATGGVLQFGYYRVVDFLHSSVGEIDFADNYSVTAVTVGLQP